MKCARCKSEHNTKNGVLKGIQRYKCKECGFNFTVELKRTAKPEDVKRQALLMYLEGLGFHSKAKFKQFLNPMLDNSKTAACNMDSNEKDAIIIRFSIQSFEY